jgi:uncharacterized membrane protein
MFALFVYLLCLVCWFGGMIFFSVFTAPIIFTVLPVAEAGKVVGGIFPRYYLMGYVAGVVSSILAAYFAMAHAPRLWWGLAALALMIAFGVTCYAGIVVRPRIDSIRAVNEEPNPDAARKAEFDRLHHLSVTLNVAAMALNLAALLSTAAALAPNAQS